MKQYKSTDIKTISLLGHSGTGKTTLAQGLLSLAKPIDSSVSNSDAHIFDFDEEETKRTQSIYTAIASCEHKDKKINIIDTPGYLDFEGEKRSGLFAGDLSVIVINAKEGIEPGCENAFKLAKKLKKPICFFVNKMDEENSGFDFLFGELKEKFGNACMPFTIPSNGKYSPVLDRSDEVVTAYYNSIAEAIATTDDALMEKFFDGKDFSEEEIHTGLTKALLSGDIYPVFFGSASKNEGIKEFLDYIAEYSCSYVTCTNTKEDGEFSAQVFKTVVDPFVGKISYIKVLSGQLKGNGQVFNVIKGQMEKIANVSIPYGKAQVQTDTLACGDIGVLVKLQFSETNDTLSVKDSKTKYDEIAFPVPMLGFAIEPKTKADEDRLSEALKKILSEDKTILFTKNNETSEQILSVMGDQSIEIIKNKLKAKYNVEIVTKTPKIQYRETITKMAEAQGKHKKQSGGAGQYGDVHIRFEPCDSDEMIFEEEIFGGAVPKQYFPPTEQGLRECMEHGVLAGYKVVGVKCTLFDGSYHEVDSKEIAFKAAARLAYKAGMPKANPIILEPIGKVTIVAPETYTGTIMGDISKRNGSILNMTMNEDGDQVIEAEAPLAEMQKYATELRSSTQGRGSFTMIFDRYQRASKEVTDKVIKESNYVQQEEE